MPHRANPFMAVDMVAAFAIGLVEQSTQLINDIPHGFNRVSNMAGKTWYWKFMMRHPEIGIRQSEATSVARASGFNNKAVGRYCTLLEKICDYGVITRPTCVRSYRSAAWS